MRLVSILSALVVMAALYVLVFERDRALEFAREQAGGGPEATQSDAPTEEASAEPVAETPADGAAAGVSVVAMLSMAQDVDNAVLVRGRTEAVRQVEVRAETSGRVISEPLRKGSRVNAGDLLCELDPGNRQANYDEADARLDEAKARVPAAEAALLEARARLEEAEINDRAATQLVTSGFASETRVAATKAARSAAMAGITSAEASVEGALTQVRSAEATLSLAQIELNRLQIRAPFEGLLETDTAELGALMQPGLPCATVIQLDPIKLVGFIPEISVDKVKVGALAGAELLSGQRVTGTVSFLSRSADPLTRTFRVEVLVENAARTIRDGQTAEIAIAADGEPAHKVPASALTLDDTGTLGLRIVDEGDVARFVPVSVLRDTTGGVLVTGLPREVAVIVVGQEYVGDGVPLLVTYRETPEVSQ